MSEADAAYQQGYDRGLAIAAKNPDLFKREYLGQPVHIEISEEYIQKFFRGQASSLRNNSHDRRVSWRAADEILADVERFAKRLVKELRADLAAKDARIEELEDRSRRVDENERLALIRVDELTADNDRLEQGWMSDTCRRQFNCEGWVHDGDHYGNCIYSRQGTDYCTAVLETVKGVNR